MNDLLLEIGTEEIPAGYIAPALKKLESKLIGKLDNNRIEYGAIKTFGTPKRLAILVSGVADKQPSLTTEVTGPPLKISFDENGKPTMAAVKFAEKVGIPVEKIKTKETKKGEYLCAVKTEKGLASKTVFKNILPDVITSIPFPKTMKWADLDMEFARPVQTITALLGKTVISFSMENIKSGRHIRGHRFMSPAKIKLSLPSEYTDSLRSAFVIADISERKGAVKVEIAKAAKELGGKVLHDDGLVDIVTNLVECPVAVAGKFDTKFLKLPKEVLITSMREHQKYFAVVDSEDNIMPCFIAVNNTRAKDMQLVARGHERVLRARLEDAIFFYEKDLESPFENMVGKLDGVLFQAKLGSMIKKVKRVQKLSEYIADKMDGSSDLKKNASRAAWLCKADLVSHVVVEFPKLQGIMGRVYADAGKEHPDVAAAIEEHHRPVYSGGILPESLAGSIVSIADKIDSICGCFSVGLFPTGASDPYALRRQAIGIVHIMQNKGFFFSLKGLIQKSLGLFGETGDKDIKEAADKVYVFLKSRMNNILEDEGYSKDVISAVTEITIDQIPNVWKRVSALEKLKGEQGFEPLAIAFKRVVNIIKKTDLSNITDINESFFQDDCEIKLYSAFNKVNTAVGELLGKGNFDQSLLEIASLRDPVDAFFDGVMVMDDDIKLRNNRLAILKNIAGLFENIADFSKIATS